MYPSAAPLYEAESDAVLYGLGLGGDARAEPLQEAESNAVLYGLGLGRSSLLTVLPRSRAVGGCDGSGRSWRRRRRGRHVRRRRRDCRHGARGLGLAFASHLGVVVVAGGGRGGRSLFCESRRRGVILWGRARCDLLELDLASEFRRCARLLGCSSYCREHLLLLLPKDQQDVLFPTPAHSPKAKAKAKAKPATPLGMRRERMPTASSRTLELPCR